MTEQATLPGVSFKTYCLGVGCMDKCRTCQHDKNWKTLNELPDVARLAMQKNMIRVKESICQMTSGKFFEPITGTLLPCEHPSFSQVEATAPGTKPEYLYTVMGNADQLIKHSFSTKYHWEQVHNDYNVLRHNSMRTRFETIAQAKLLYDELCANKLVAYRNWLD
jgi:hypothetical protein